MTADGELDEALGLVLKMCTTEQIKDVLRMRKDDGAVRVSAENKKVLVERNLKEALQAGAVKIETIFDLIRGSEENGAQHIWYYKLKPGLSHLMTPEAVAARLWGRNWKSAIASFPSLLLKNEGYVISDFRQLTKKPQDWVLKIYGHTIITHPTGKEEPGEDGRFWREYVHVPLRTVILVRWNSPDLLEIRVDRNESRKRVEVWHQVAWEYIRSALIKSQFAEWDLERALRRMVLDWDKHSDLYTFRDAGVMDKGDAVLAQFQTVKAEGSLLQSQTTISSIKDFVEDGGKLKGLAITWLSQKTALSSDLRVLASLKDSHEVLIGAQCKAEDVDHVTDQFRRFRKAVS